MPVILSSIMLEVGKVPVQKISSLKSKFWSKNYCSVNIFLVVISKSFTNTRIEMNHSLRVFCKCELDQNPF